jgi:hypothetical protein
MTVLVERRDSVYICTIRKKEEKQTLTPPTPVPSPGEKGGCYVLTLFFIHTTSTCIVRLGGICRAMRYSNQYFLFVLIWKG